MKSQYYDISIEDTVERLKKRLNTIGFNKIDVEDDDPEFKNFFAASNEIFEDSFFTIQMQLFHFPGDEIPGFGMEFHVYFFTKEGRNIQRSLSLKGYKSLRTFLDEKVFEPTGLKAWVYYPSDPSDRQHRQGKRRTSFFPDNVPYVEIHVAGWLCSNESVKRKSTGVS